MNEMGEQIVNICLFLVLVLVAISSCISAYSRIISYSFKAIKYKRWFYLVFISCWLLFGLVGDALINVCFLHVGYDGNYILSVMFYLIFMVGVFVSVCQMISSNMSGLKVFGFLLIIACISFMRTIVQWKTRNLLLTNIEITDEWLIDSLLYYILIERTVVVVGKRLREVNEELKNGTWKSISNRGEISGGM